MRNDSFTVLFLDYYIYYYIHYVYLIVYYHFIICRFIFEISNYLFGIVELLSLTEAVDYDIDLCLKDSYDIDYETKVSGCIRLLLH